MVGRGNIPDHEEREYDDREYEARLADEEERKYQEDMLDSMRGEMDGTITEEDPDSGRVEAENWESADDARFARTRWGSRVRYIRFPEGMTLEEYNKKKSRGEI